MRALDVPLLLAVRRVHAHLLDAHEILAGGDLLGETEGEGSQVPREPALVCPVPGDSSAQLVDFEPFTRPVVIAHVSGGLGEVDLD